MLNFLMPLVKNPLARLLVSKTIEKVSHHLEKEKIIRVREIEAAKTVSVEQVRQQQHSIKDEILTFLVAGILLACFIPQTQPFMLQGFEIMRTAPTEFWWAVLICFSGSFGLSTLRNIRNGKKK